MLFMPSNITKRGDVFYFRARIPVDLAAAYGRSHVSISLRTQDRATAKARAQEHAVALRRELEALHGRTALPTDALTGTVLHLSDTDIEHLCSRYRASMLCDDEVSRIKGLSPVQVEVDLDLYESAVPAMRQAFAAGDRSAVYPNLRQFLRSIDLSLPSQAPSFDRLAIRFQEAELEVHEALLQRRRGVAVPIPVTPTNNVALDDVLRCWKTQAQRRDPKTSRAFEVAFANFGRHCQAPSARLVRRTDVVAFRTKMLSGGDYSSATVARQLSFLRAAFQCAMNDGLIEANPFDGVKVATAQAVKQKARRPFTIEQLNRIFSGPVYQPGFAPRKSLGEACRWLPLLSLYLGARLEELAQLDKSDVRLDRDHGPYISINAEGDKRLKTASSARNIPVHPTLVALGFLEFVRRQPGPRLFPALRPDRYGKLGTQFSTWFGRYLDGLGITDSGLVFHSMRHAFIQECKEKASVIPPEVREAMVGHLSASHIARVYGHTLYPLAPQVAALKQLKFNRLDLASVGIATCPPEPPEQLPRARQRRVSKVLLTKQASTIGQHRPVPGQ